MALLRMALAMVLKGAESEGGEAVTGDEWGVHAVCKGRLESLAQLWAGITTGRHSSWLFPVWREEADPEGWSQDCSCTRAKFLLPPPSLLPLLIMQLPPPSTLPGLHRATGHKIVPERERGKIWDQPLSGAVLVQDHCR